MEILGKLKRLSARLLGKCPNWVIYSSVWGAGLLLLLGAMLISLQTAEQFFDFSPNGLNDSNISATFFLVVGAFLFLTSLLTYYSKLWNENNETKEKKELSKNLKFHWGWVNFVFFLVTVAGAVWVLKSPEQGSILTFNGIIYEKASDKIKDKCEDNENKFAKLEENLVQRISELERKIQ